MFTTGLQYLNMKNQPNYSVTEVVWAKIRGYPWWPAIITNVQDEDPDEVSFKVNFFGDTTHSFLDQSKIAKFQQNYTQYQAQGRANKKLVKSILEAETHLKNKSIELNLIKKPPKTKLSISRKQSTLSKVCQSVQQINSSDLPKEAIITRQQKAIMTEIIMETEILVPEKLQKSQKKRPELKSKDLPKSIIIQSSSQSPLQTLQKSKPQKYRHVIPMKLQKQKQKQKEKQKEKELQKSAQKIKIKNVTNIQYEQQVNKYQINKEKKNYENSNTIINPNLNTKYPVLAEKLKLRQKRNSEEMNEKTERKQKIKDLIQQVKKYATGPQQIIDYLNSLDITTENIKQILECEVVEILNDSPNQSSIDLLARLRQTLLRKYFDDQEEDAQTKIKPIKSKSKNLIKKNNSKILQVREQTIQTFQNYLRDEYYNLKQQKAHDEALRLQELIYEKDNTCGDDYQELVSVLSGQFQLKKYSIKQLFDFINVFSSKQNM